MVQTLTPTLGQKFSRLKCSSFRGSAALGSGVQVFMCLGFWGSGFWVGGFQGSCFQGWVHFMDRQEINENGKDQQKGKKRKGQKPLLRNWETQKKQGQRNVSTSAFLKIRCWFQKTKLAQKNKRSKTRKRKSTPEVNKVVRQVCAL